MSCATNAAGVAVLAGIMVMVGVAAQGCVGAPNQTVQPTGADAVAPATREPDPSCAVASGTLLCHPQHNWSTYINARFGVVLQYPPSWTRNPRYSGSFGERYEGPDGFFQVNAGTGGSLDDVARSHAEHKLKPYGSQPSIIPLQVAGEEARLIWPSDDQPNAMGGQAQLLVRYPRPRDLPGDIYPHFILWADKQHVYAIARSIQFLTDQSP